MMQTRRGRDSRVNSKRYKNQFRRHNTLSIHTGINNIMGAILHCVDPSTTNEEASIERCLALEDRRVESVRESAA